MSGAADKQGWEEGLATSPMRRAQGKLPAFLLYTGDWMKDPSLSMCSPSTRGIWIDFICAMHELGRSGQVTGTVEQLCRVCRCTAAEMRSALIELKNTRTADISERDGRITVTSRRLLRERHARDGWRERKQHQRDRGDPQTGSRESPGACHGHVTPPLSCSVSGSLSDPDPPPSGQGEERAPGLPAGLIDHPVMRGYWAEFRPERLPPIGAQERAISSISDLLLWQTVLDFWRDNQYRPESLGKMVACYLEGGPRRQRARRGKGAGPSDAELLARHESFVERLQNG